MSWKIREGPGRRVMASASSKKPKMSQSVKMSGGSRSGLSGTAAFQPAGERTGSDCKGRPLELQCPSRHNSRTDAKRPRSSRAERTNQFRSEDAGRLARASSRFSRMAKDIADLIVGARVRGANRAEKIPRRDQNDEAGGFVTEQIVFPVRSQWSSVR